MIYVLGIDPGGLGAMCLTSLDGSQRKVFAYSKYTPHDIAEVLKFTGEIQGDEIECFIEDVHSMPNNGKKQAFSFGKNFGFWLGLLTGLNIPYNTVLPIKWQNVLKVRARGLEYKQRKNALKECAQRLFPKLNPTLETCDAILIAEYGRRVIVERKRAAR